MDYSKFDFTKFNKEKWQEILTEIEGKHQYVDDVKVYYYDEAKKEIYPVVELSCVSDTEVDGLETYFLCFSAFDVKSNGRILDVATKKWRRIMIKEFEAYAEKLLERLQVVREQKIQQADEEYIRALNEINI